MRSRSRLLPTRLGPPLRLHSWLLVAPCPHVHCWRTVPFDEFPFVRSRHFPLLSETSSYVLPNA